MDSQQTPPPIPPTLPLDINMWTTWAMNTIRNYGLPFVLLAIAVWYFHARTEKLETQIEQCQRAHIETVTMQNGALIRAINDNTQALNRLQISLKQ